MKDHDLLEKLKQGDKAALSRLYQEFRTEFVQWLISRYNSDMEDARDIYQFAILTLYKKAVDGKLDQIQSSIKTYLFGIGKNQALVRLKKGKRYKYDIVELIDDQPEQHQEKEQHEQQLNLVHESLQSLGEPCRSIIEWSYFHKMDLETLRERMGHKNTDTTKNVRYKCMERIRKLVKDKWTLVKGGEQ